MTERVLLFFSLIHDTNLNFGQTNPPTPPRPASWDLLDRNLEYCLGNISTHLIAHKDDKVHLLPASYPAPKATTIVQHPLIKKGTAVRVQPASESAGYEEEQCNPPTPGLAVSVTVIAAPLGASSPGTKPTEVKLGVAKEDGGRLKCGERG